LFFALIFGIFPFVFELVIVVLIQALYFHHSFDSCDSDSFMSDSPRRRSPPASSNVAEESSSEEENGGVDDDGGGDIRSADSHAIKNARAKKSFLKWYNDPDLDFAAFEFVEADYGKFDDFKARVECRLCQVCLIFTVLFIFFLKLFFLLFRRSVNPHRIRFKSGLTLPRILACSDVVVRRGSVVKH
jgi:hypothetical protein